ncbi:restriction endonuclease subunit M, partial [Candidatus Woesearchaeota archaeon]|nr:restriction endonuclease subunit M [Candidatus Woesearchaeota archaeon]
HKFETEPTLETIQNIAQIISWNIWQMDGLKGVIPNSCKDKIVDISNIFETKTEIKKCKGCETQSIKLHNGIYCNIMDWEEKDKETGKAGKVIRFIDLLKK